MSEPTPFRFSSEKSLVHPTTIPCFPSKTQSPEDQKQEHLMFRMKLELNGATFESESLMTTLFPQPTESRVLAVLSTLRAKNLSADYAWPSSGTESRFYGHLHKILNGINTVVQNHFGDNFYANIVYSIYDRQTTDSVKGSHPLKPDLVGCERKLTEAERVSWTRDIIIPVEVKSTWSDLVAQAATYARSQFVADSHRLFSLVIAFNHKSRCLRFLVFHRGGLTSTPEMDLRKKNGWRAFVSVMIAMASWPASFQAGMDNASSNHAYLLPFGHYTIDEIFSNRPCVRGRATQISRLVYMPLGSDPPNQLGETIGSSMNSGGFGRSPRLRKAVAKDESGEHIEKSPRNATLVCWETSSPSDGPPPKILVIKDSHPLEIRNFEGEMLHSVRGQFGVPELYASYIVRGPDNSPHSTECFSPSDCEFWDVFGSGGIHKPEIRVHTYQLLKTPGKPLGTASSPHELLEGILHSMIGYLNYFKQGWLHRDVSEGNIMLMTDRMTREKLDIDLKEYPKLEVPTQWTECVGMLVDADLAIRWRDAVREPATQLVGTLQFISVRIYRCLYFKRPYKHTPLDDLESFKWVLLWATLHIADQRNELSTWERSTYKSLLSTDPNVQGDRLTYLVELMLRRSSSRVVNWLLPLIEEWHLISSDILPLLVRLERDIYDEDSPHQSDAMSVDDSNHDAKSKKDDEFTDGVAKLAYDFFGQYLEKGYEHLKFLPKTWR